MNGDLFAPGGARLFVGRAPARVLLRITAWEPVRRWAVNRWIESCSTNHCHPERSEGSGVATRARSFAALRM